MPPAGAHPAPVLSLRLCPFPALAFCLLVMVLDFGDRRKWYFDDLSIRAFHLYAGSGEGLSGFHAANNAPHPLALRRYNFNIVLAVKWL